ncbi:hypothetical protein CcCBS67573_g09003 [Chytriomyces confervae]|uniref:Ribosomal RNA-processing protein 17 n=1 Tax=Chytriomyces confervae TaxID=246404 RepID=A0A507E8P9_9FUNG|nr:hypothetical protein HDU80_009523 [Chytriomyces hyalinus]TPX60439.1 hypothetical protein CcCBS67573_g09003 [Chytriomyces confervae]
MAPNARPKDAKGKDSKGKDGKSRGDSKGRDFKGKDSKGKDSKGGGGGGGKSFSKGKGRKGKHEKVKPYSFKVSAKAKKNQEELIEYDDASRSDYLTGFHKRNLEKIKKAKERDAALDRETLRESRKEKRLRISGVMDEIEHIESINESRRQAQLQRESESERSSNVVEKKFVSKSNKLVTVTIEDFEM